MKERTKDERDEYQEKIGVKFNQGSNSFLGFLTNFKTRSFRDREHDNEERMAVLCFFQSEEGELVKCLIPYRPYFYVAFEPGMEKEVQSYLESKLEKIESIEMVEKVDLQEINHLSGRKKQYLKINFRTVKDLTNAKAPVKGIIDKRRRRQNEDDNLFYGNPKNKEFREVTDLITGIRQFDVSFHSRVCIDLGLRAGKWFEVDLEDKIVIKIHPAAGQRGMPELKILAYDIETSKDPLKFPDAEKDEVMMISLMYEGEAFLIVNCGFCGDQVKQFEYEPKPQFACHVSVFNQPSEKHTLLKFAQFIQNYNPNIITSYNGDRFDYPFLQRRFELNYLKFTAEMGVTCHDGEYYGSHMAHLDCFCWVERDAFLPQGSRGLKAVTKAKLNYDPIEVDPEEMVWLAKNSTQRLAEYSISDAVATFFLYMKHIHGFIFALASIIPMFPDEVLRKGSGTLCENLLMAEAYTRGIIIPNKKIEEISKFYKGNLLDSETYTGGKVQCLRTGVYRADLTTDFTLQPQAFQELIDNVDEIVKFAVGIEMASQSCQNISNLAEVRQEIVQKLQALRDVKNPHKYDTNPLIYHIDVASMYPNIILTNRLQPVSIVSDKTCSGCLFNQPESRCKRELQWEWRGTTFPLNEGEYLQIREKTTAKLTSLHGLELEKAIRDEVKSYSQRVYKRAHNETIETRADVVCMRENSFYVDTVRDFRDRRYEYKRLAKSSEMQYKEMTKNNDGMGAKESEGLMILYESMQLAHKIILNSFYGYVMRKGARWYSMEMAAMVTYLGSNIISDSNNYVKDRIGKPLELDTDGIWMLLPKGFPEDIKINFRSGKSLKLSYPCHILNHLIYQKYSNDQYQWLENGQQWKYGSRKEMTIFFQIDGPYKAMMIPAAKQKQKTNRLDIQEHNTQMLKKRYVVFNFDNKIKEFKGFEMKRRGQLRITKVFQEQIFPQYLKGSTLQECYAACAETAKKYLAIIQKKGQALDTHQILDYLQQSRVLSRQFSDYGASKGVALGSARKLVEFLGPDVVKGKGGLCCYFVISKFPHDRPVTDRAIPTQIFDAQIETQRQFLLRWTKDDELLKGDVDIRKILDWDYYFDRLSTQVHKMICIPAVLQGIPNPVPELELPEWLQKKTFDMRHHRQHKLSSFFFLKPTTPQHFALASGKKQEIVIERKQIIQSPSNFKHQMENVSNIKHNNFSMMKNFKSWLGEQKKIWKEKKLDNVSEVSRVGETKSILQIIPQKTAGNFNVWYWAGGRIQQLLITMKRRYYCQGRGTKKAPRQQGEAIEIIADQDTFIKQQDYFQTLIGKKFYETRMPLLISLIMKKGNLWKTNKQTMTYQEEDIQEVYGQYLPNLQRNPLPVVHLVHEKVMLGRSIWALIIPKYHEYIFAFVDKSKGSQHDELLTMVRKILKSKDIDSSGQERISIEHYAEEKEAALAIDKKLEALTNQVKQKFMIVLRAENIQSTKDLGVTYLQNEGPVLLMSQIKMEKVDILDWRSKSLRAVLEEEEMRQDLNRQIMWSRYAQVPLCNLEQGAELLDNITNIQLGRLLHSGDQITWWNDFNAQLTTTYESAAFTGKIINPGIFSNYCVEVAMENLAVNTVAVAEELGLEDRETAGLVIKGNVNSSSKVESLDEMTQVKKPFQYVRKMVKLWIKEFEETESFCANELLRNFHRWITTQSGALYEPLLARLVNEIMKKVFHLLARRLEQLGLHLVQANFTKILVTTQKHTPAEARSCVQYALKKCVQDNQKLFKYIGLTPSDQLYKALILKDQFNFVSVLQNGAFYYKLDLTNLMSPPIAKYFRLLLVQFVQKLAGLQEQLIEQFGDNRMQLFLDYQKLLQQRLTAYISNEFTNTIIDVLRKLHSDFQSVKDRRKNQPQTDFEQSQQLAELSKDGEEEDEHDSFIDDAEDLEQSKNEANIQVQEAMEIELKDESELECLVENVFSFLNSDENIRDTLHMARKSAVMELRLEPSIDYGSIKPIYPTFELSCSVCYLVNEQPGNCSHCDSPLVCTKQLERAVWKMMQEQGRDLYCGICNRIKQDHLRKCGCGGKWVLKQFPLSWVPFSQRAGDEWQFVNEVFSFMGIF